MIILISGTSHTGKTALAQKLLEKYKYPYICIDHLKMGLIRSGNTNLTPLSSEEELTAYLWPIICEMIKTAVENNQNLIVEGCYIPYDWAKDFGKDYLKKIRYVCLVMSEDYIKNHLEDIKNFANVIEKRLYNDFSLEEIIKDNTQNLNELQKRGQKYLLIDKNYESEIESQLLGLIGENT